MLQMAKPATHQILHCKTTPDIPEPTAPLWKRGVSRQNLAHVVRCDLYPTHALFRVISSVVVVNDRAKQL